MLVSHLKMVYVGISCSPVEPLQIESAARRDEARGQPKQQQWSDPGTSVCKNRHVWQKTILCTSIFPTWSALWVYPCRTDARAEAMGPVGVEGASLGIQVQSLGA